MYLIFIRIVILYVILLMLMIGYDGGCGIVMGVGWKMGWKMRVFGGGCGFRLLGCGFGVRGFLCMLLIGYCWC